MLLWLLVSWLLGSCSSDVFFPERQQQLIDACRYLPVFYSRGVQHFFRSDKSIVAGIFIGEINDFRDAGLYDSLGAFIAGEKGRINFATLQIHPDIIEDGIQFGVTDIRILGFEEFTGLGPGEIIVITAGRQPVIPGTDNLILRVHNTGTDLGIGILAAPCGKQGYTHEVFVPGDIVCSFFHKQL